MTKKDYELIASVLKHKQVFYILKMGSYYYDQLCKDFADTLASKNPRFDKDKFLKACGVEVEHIHDKSCYMNCMKKMF